MKRGTKIKYRGSEYNDDGDRPVSFKNVPDLKTKEELIEAIKDPENHFMNITDKKIYGVDKLSFSKIYFLLIEPNPVTFYFALAFDANNQLNTAKQNLEAVLNSDIHNVQKAQAFSYVFRVSSVSIIFSFLALEAFINQMLPDHGLIEYKMKKISKEKVERTVPFINKLNIIIPSITKKDFSIKYPEKMNKILILKKLRDDLIHLKQINTGLTSYNQIYQDILDVDLKSIVLTVKSLINFYSPKLIENYDLKTKIK